MEIAAIHMRSESFLFKVIYKFGHKDSKMRMGDTVEKKGSKKVERKRDMMWSQQS
jgi:hypothetical protein